MKMRKEKGKREEKVTCVLLTPHTDPLFAWTTWTTWTKPATARVSPVQAPTFPLDRMDQRAIPGPTSTPGAIASARCLRWPSGVWCCVEWVAAAGGWSDAAAIHLPVALPKGLALARLKAHARALRMQILEDEDDPELMAWLRGAK